jgi:hypothetical protein
MLLLDILVHQAGTQAHSGIWADDSDRREL